MARSKTFNRGLRLCLAVAAPLLLAGSTPAASRKPALSVGSPRVWTGETAGDQFGVRGLCYDLTGDGRPELIVGARNADPNGVTDAGSVFVYSGKDGKLLHRFDGAVPNGVFGYSIQCGDINRDNRPDVVIGAPNQGRVFVYSGRDWRLLHQIEPQPNTLQLGVSLALADTNRDRYLDIITGGPNFGQIGGGNGSVVVSSGKDGTFLHRFDGADFGDQFGLSTAGGDVNKDGYADIVVGAPRARPLERVNAGSVTVYSGRDGSVLRAFAGAAPGDHLGISVAACDLNLDRYADVVTGAFGADPAGVLDAGSLFVYSGRNGALLQRFNGSRVADHMGWSVACVPLDTDKYPEILTGGIQEALPFPDRTENLWLFSGKTGAQLHHVEVPAEGAVFGNWVTACAPTGRVPGQIVVGAPEADPDGKTDAGAVYVFPVTR